MDEMRETANNPENPENQEIPESQENQETPESQEELKNRESQETPENLPPQKTEENGNPSVGEESVQEETSPSSEDEPLPETKDGSERSDENLTAAIEAILFTTGEAVKASRLSEVLKVDQSKIKELADALIAEYESENHGVRIIRLENAYQMCTKQEFYDDLITLEVAPKKPILTDVILETLSIIAYKQPVTKAEIERIRGVNSDHAVNRLVEYDLVRELGRLNAPGRPILFGTTEEFLRNFGVESKEDLPAIDTVKMEDFKAEAEEEAQQKVDI
jgi:segregation and condensation protein B